MYFKKHLKVLTVVSVVLLIVMCVIGFFRVNTGDNNSLTAEQETYVYSNRTLAIGVPNYERPPHLSADYHGDYYGTDIDAINAVCKNVGFMAKIVPIDWTSRHALLENGNIDCLWGGQNSYEITDQLLYTSPYYKDMDVLLVKKSDAKRITSLADLENKTIGVVDGSRAASSVAAGGVKLKLLKTASIETAMTRFKDGEVQALAVSTTELDENTLKKLGVSIVDEPLYVCEYAIAVSSDNDMLKNILDIGIYNVYGKL